MNQFNYDKKILKSLEEKEMTQRRFTNVEENMLMIIFAITIIIAFTVVK